jgi:hypothetical protein
MPFSIQCPACQAKLNAPDNLAGKRVKCPKCQTPVTVLAAGAPPAASVAPAASRAPAAGAAPKAAAPAKATAKALAAASAAPAPAVAKASAAALTPVVVAAGPVSAQPAAKGAASSFPWILAGVIGTGGLLLVGIVAVVAIILSAPGGAPKNKAVAAAPKAYSPPAPPPPPAVAAPAPEVPAAPPPAASPAATQGAAGQVEWVLYENADKGIKAVFPGGQPEPIDPLAAIEDPQTRKLSEAILKQMTVVGKEHGGRKYTLTCAPLLVSGIAPSVYLDRQSAALKVLHPGFSIEPVAADKSAPLRDYVLTKGDAGKLLRVVVGQGQVYQLLIVGEAGLAIGDPAAQEFFGKFECATAAAVPVAAGGESGSKTSVKKKKIAAAPSDVPDNIEWRPFQGSKIAFTINFPGVTPEAEDPLSLVPDSNRQNLSNTWASAGVVAESFSAVVGDRRYGVTAFRDPNKKQEGSIRFAGQMEGLLRSFAQDIHQEVRDHAIRARRPPSKLEVLGTNALTMGDGSKAIVRQAWLGNYGFVVRVEGPAALEDLDLPAHKFLDSLQPPPDAATLPLDGNPLPGPKPARQSRSDFGQVAQAR